MNRETGLALFAILVAMLVFWTSVIVAVWSIVQ